MRALGNPGSSSIGNVIKDNTGAHLLFFSGPPGFHSVNAAKLLALQTGSQGVAKLRCSNFIAEDGSSCAIGWASLSSKTS